VRCDFARLLVQPEGSQTSTKGILALAGACCGGDAAPIVHRYVKQWYGYRGAQSKALLQVLAWVDHPSATQVVLSVANRFRTKGIQEEAMRRCQLLADRKGLTLDELADRTVPTASLDDDGAMELDYGSRVFTARFSEEMTSALTNQSGKTISSLPDGNQSDDPEKVKLAKSALSAARKELKVRPHDAEGQIVRSPLHAEKLAFRGMGHLSQQTPDRGTLLPTASLGGVRRRNGYRHFQAFARWHSH
jgi:hypothetical protein